VDVESTSISKYRTKKKTASSEKILLVEAMQANGKYKEVRKMRNRRNI